VYLPFLAKTNYKGVTTTVQFESDGELKNPAMTFYAYKDGKQVALN
jgi:branched-chain amino acid transport system substrate-binding protein